MTKTYANKHFRFVFQPKEVPNPSLFAWPRIRFLVGAGQLSKYIGEKNAESVLKAAQISTADKTTLKFRKAGKIEIYVK